MKPQRSGTGPTLAAFSFLFFASAAFGQAPPPAAPATPATETGIAGVLWPILIPVCVAIIGTRQLGLAILMHEAAHGGLSTHARLNDGLGHWLCAVPVVPCAHEMIGRPSAGMSPVGAMTRAVEIVGRSSTSDDT